MSLKSAYSRGIVHIIPVIIVALVVFVGLTAISYLRDQEIMENKQTLVLGDEDEGEERAEVEVTNVGTTTQVRTEEKVEYHTSGRRLRIENEDGVGRLTVEDDEENDEEENETELEDEDEVEVEGPDREKLRIRIESNKFIVKRNQVEARTSFPLSIDLTTNELIVTTPSGERRVTILPDQAVSNMLGQNAISRVVETRIETLDTGQIIYKVEGVENQKLLGIIDVEIQKTGIILGDTGEVAEIQQDLISQVLDLLSS